MQVVPGNAFQNTVPGAAATQPAPSQPATDPQTRAPGHAVKAAGSAHAALSAGQYKPPARAVANQQAAVDTRPAAVPPNAPRGSVIDILI